MRISRELVFKPMTIILETEEEVSMFWHTTKIASVSGTSSHEYCYRHNLDESSVIEFNKEVWERLDKCYPLERL